MPKMRGFLRTKEKINDADWAIAQMRTAARLEDLFSPDESAASKAAATVPPATVPQAPAAVDVVGVTGGTVVEPDPTPWPGGARPPIIVVGVSDVVSVLGQSRAVQPAATMDAIATSVATTTADTAASTASPAGPDVTRIDARSPIDEGPAIGLGHVRPKATPAEPRTVTAEGGIGRVGARESLPETGNAGTIGRAPAGATRAKTDASPVRPIGVMARPGEDVGADSWQLPARPSADVANVAPAFAFPTRPAPDGVAQPSAGPTAAPATGAGVATLTDSPVEADTADEEPEVEQPRVASEAAQAEGSRDASVAVAAIADGDPVDASPVVALVVRPAATAAAGGKVARRPAVRGATQATRRHTATSTTRARGTSKARMAEPTTATDPTATAPTAPTAEPTTAKVASARPRAAATARTKAAAKPTTATRATPRTTARTAPAAPKSAAKPAAKSAAKPAARTKRATRPLATKPAAAAQAPKTVARRSGTGRGAGATRSAGTSGRSTPGTPVGRALVVRRTALARRGTATRIRVVPIPAAHCPYCALLLDPPPTTSRRCDRCRQRIVVKAVDGHAVYLTEAAVEVFEAERVRLANATQWTRSRDRWLQLAFAAGASPDRIDQAAKVRLSDQAVAGARSIYMNAMERIVRTAKAESRWDDASRIRRDQAAAMSRVAGAPHPVPADIVRIFRDGVAAELRGISEITRDAELVAANCCDACRIEDGLIVRITAELKTPRLPHATCPRGLCRCRWDLPTSYRRTMRRYLRRRPSAGSRPGPEAADPLD